MTAVAVMIALICALVILSSGKVAVEAFAWQPSHVTTGWSRNVAKVSTSKSAFLTRVLANDQQQHDNKDESGTVHQHLSDRNSVEHMTRRSFWRTSTSSLAALALGSTIGWVSGMSPSLAKDDARALILPSRLESNNLVPPMYGMDGTDVFYPSWLTGTWKVVSVTTHVQAPCGPALFGGNETLRLARQEIGPVHALVYESRFLPMESSSSSCIADREFNVKSIAKVALGPNSIVDISLATPNHFACLVLPPQKSTTSSENNPLLNVDILVLQRRQESLDDLHFACSEVVREIVTKADPASTGASSQSNLQQQQSTAIFKEVETISLYTAVLDDSGAVSSVKCQQRSASFLVPRREDPMSIAMWQATQGLPTDVRCYDVTYTRRT